MILRRSFPRPIGRYAPASGAKMTKSKCWRGAPCSSVHAGKRADVEFPSRGAHDAGEVVSPELLAARQEAPARPGRELLKLLRTDGLLAPISLIAALFLAGAGLAMEALLFRALLELGPELGLSGQRFGALAAVIAFSLFSHPARVSDRR